MDRAEVHAVLGGPPPIPGQRRHVHPGTLVIVHFDDDGFVKGIELSPRHRGTVADLDGLLLKGNFDKLRRALTRRGVPILPAMPPFQADGHMMHLPEQGINIGRQDREVESAWMGQRDLFTPKAVAERGAELAAFRVERGLPA